MSIAKRLVVSLLLTGIAVLAQAPAFNPPGLLVHLNVTALDGNNPVGDLSADDFKISDQGKPASILFFRRNGAAQAAAASGPAQFTNRPNGRMPQATAVLFDLLNESQADRLNIWHKLEGALPQLESGEGVYFYVLTLEGVLTPIHAAGPKSPSDQTWPKEAAEALNKVMKSASHARPSGMSDEDAVKKTYVALETIGNQLATVPGIRHIVWITDVVPNVWNTKGTCSGDWVDCALYVAHLGVTLDRDHVAVNPLSDSPDPNLTHDMELMAGLTGGRPYFGVNLGPVLKQVANEAVNSYTVYYEPAADNWDSKFHKVKVTCERKGLKVISQQRYYAIPDPRPAATRQQAALVAAYQNVNDLAQIGLRATVGAATGSPKSVHLQLEIDGADVLVREQAGHFMGGLTFLLSDVGATGPLGDPTVSSTALALTPAQHEAVLKGGIPLTQDHALKDGAQKIRFVVLDQSDNAVGSLTMTLP